MLSTNVAEDQNLGFSQLVSQGQQFCQIFRLYSSLLLVHLVKLLESRALIGLTNFTACFAESSFCLASSDWLKFSRHSLTGSAIGLAASTMKFFAEFVMSLAVFADIRDYHRAICTNSVSLLLESLN